MVMIWLLIKLFVEFTVIQTSVNMCISYLLIQMPQRLRNILILSILTDNTMLYYWERKKKKLKGTGRDIV